MRIGRACDGGSGEFVTKGYSVMLGYWNQPDKTAESIVDGWMRTGDLAVMDEDGYVQITGRIRSRTVSHQLLQTSPLEYF